MDLISRDVVLKALTAAVHTDGFHKDSLIERHELGEDEIEDTVRSVPPVDCASVIRCKYCKRRCLDTWCDLLSRYVSPDDYCSFGILKEAAHDTK